MSDTNQPDLSDNHARIERLAVLVAVLQPASPLPPTPARQLFPTRTMAEIVRAQQAVWQDAAPASRSPIRSDALQSQHPVELRSGKCD